MHTHNCATNRADSATQPRGARTSQVRLHLLSALSQEGGAELKATDQVCFTSVCARLYAAQWDVRHLEQWRLSLTAWVIRLREVPRDDMMIAVCQMCLLMNVMVRQNALSGSFSATAAFWLFMVCCLLRLRTWIVKAPQIGMVEYLIGMYGDRDLKYWFSCCCFAESASVLRKHHWFVTEQHCPSVDTQRTAPVQFMETQETTGCVCFKLT